jgi:hypothetical protein
VSQPDQPDLGAAPGRRAIDTEYEAKLGGDPNKLMRVEFTRHGRAITNYAVLLTFKEEAETSTVRLYDGAHGVNEMHRYTRTHGKRHAEVFHHGTLGEGMRAATTQIKGAYQSMIEGWQAQ